MMYLTDELVDALAAEYVLGTQSWQVRERLRKLLQQEPRLAERVAFWEANLNQLTEGARPVPVPPWVWRRIENALNPESESKTGWWQDLFVWRWAAGLAVATAVFLAVVPQQQPVPELPVAEGGFVLVLTDEESKTAFLVSRQDRDSPIRAEAITVPVMTVAQAYELWLLPPDSAPLSLGLLNEQGNTLLLPDLDVSQLVQPGYGMAVSIEPPGGSPTGSPTGPVVYTGSIKSL